MDLKGYVRIFYPHEGGWEVETVYMEIRRAGNQLVWDPLDYSTFDRRTESRFPDHVIHIGDFHSIHWNDNWGACFTHNIAVGWHLKFEEHHLSRCWGRV